MADVKFVWNIAVILIGFYTLQIIGINAIQEVLLDTNRTTTEKLNWTTKIVLPDNPDPKNNGWNEVSTYIGESLLKIYTSCYVSSQNVNNWLRTPFIEVGHAKSLYVEMVFTMRKCIKHSNIASVESCRETFNVYSYEADRDIANNEMPSWDKTVYNLVDKIPADVLGESASDIFLNNETRFISLNQNLRGIYFAFQDTGSCVALVTIKVYFKKCANHTQNYALFTETPTGPMSSSTELKDGICVAHASEKTLPTLRCMSDGTWDIPQGGCQCDPGYEGIDGTKCDPCQRNHYKWEAGDDRCRQCPANSYTDSLHSIECQCFNSYYRADTDSKNMHCTQPPTAPSNPTVIHSTDTSVQIKWDPPAKLGERKDIQYRIECPTCENSVMFSPKRQGFNTTIAELSGLTPSTSYRITIHSKNGVSAISQVDKSVILEFTTQSSQIDKLQTTEIGQDYITLKWEVGDEVEMNQFEVKFNIKGDKTILLNYTRNPTITIRQLRKLTEYEFQVRGQSNKGWGEYSAKHSVTTGRTDPGEKELDQGPSPVIIIASIISVILCMAIATIMIVILLRRNRRQDGKNPDIDGPYHHVTVPLFQPSGTIKSYVDPHTYEDPNQAVREFTREIDASHITIESVIGGGEFGDVCKGKLRVPNRPEMTVAIKTLKPGATDKNRLDFLTEASIMGQFDDPNVIFLEGVVTKSHPIMIVTEYMSNGSLDSFLRKNDGQLTVIQLVGMMRGIASGMRYLSEMGYVHRDLAARNILTNDSLVCKVADFGLSREVDIDTTDGAYTTKGGKIPVRWTSPEAITFRKFTSASDVWSFGVVMWEVISYGERPYWNWSNQDVIKAVDKGYRLPPPMECPEAIHQLMLDSWQKERNNRPKFVAIVKCLDKLIRAPELLRKMAKPRPHVFIDNTPSEVENFSSVEEWLNVIKMERYCDNFVSHGVTSMEHVMRLTVKDLDTLGITLLGHQKKIMNSVQTLRAQLLGPQVHLPHMQMSEGFLV